MKSEPEVFGIDDLAKSAAQDHPLGWRSELSGARISCATDAPRRSRVLLSLQLRGARHRRHREDREARDTRITPRSMPTTRTSIPTAIATNRAGTWSTCKSQRKFRGTITLATLREHDNGALKGLALLKRGNRLSVTPVSAAHWKFILDLASVARDAREKLVRHSTSRECATNHTLKFVRAR